MVVLPDLPVVVNGQVLPGDTDAWTFSAKKGQHIVIAASVREIIPYLADAVPGWFQAVLELTDSDGNELAFADSFHHRQDPVIHFEVPQDGHYTIRIHDSLYRGREDFVYRITIGEIPFLTSFFPLGTRPGDKTLIELDGWNLTRKTLELGPLSRRGDRPVRWQSVLQADGTEIRFPLQTDRLQNVSDQEPNNTPEQSQEITNRIVINGRIDQPGDVDVFRLESAGRVTVDVQARRHGSPLDSLVSLTDAGGQEIAFNDDNEDRTQALLTHHADSHLTTTLPERGTYYLRIEDAQQNGGREFVYRMYVRPPEPDFELRVAPSGIVTRPGTNVPITVFVMRNDGFDQEIELSLVDAPQGFQLSGAVIPAAADRLPLTLYVPPRPTDGPLVLEMEGRACQRRGSRDILTRPAVPAQNMMQAFIWYHLVPMLHWRPMVSQESGSRLTNAPWNREFRETCWCTSGGNGRRPLRVTTPIRRSDAWTTVTYRPSRSKSARVAEHRRRRTRFRSSATTPVCR